MRYEDVRQLMDEARPAILEKAGDGAVDRRGLHARMPVQYNRMWCLAAGRRSSIGSDVGIASERTVRQQPSVDGLPRRIGVSCFRRDLAVAPVGSRTGNTLRDLLGALVRVRSTLGYSAHDAQDLTQGFFARLLEKDFLKDVDHNRGQFRSFLLVALKHFLSHERESARAQKRGGGRVPFSLNFQVRRIVIVWSPRT